MKEMDFDKVLNRAAEYCSVSEKCPADLKRKLLSWGVPDSYWDRIIENLKKNKFLDEARFCRAFVNDKFRFNKWGKRRIYYELKKKEVADIYIIRALNGISDEDNLSLLKALLLSKKKALHSDKNIRSRLFRFALDRGFKYEEIEYVIKYII